MKLKNRLIDAGILTAVFVIAVIVFSYITNKGNDNMTADMGTATYPQISFSYNGYGLNSLNGYAKKMDIPAMRDTITPVSLYLADVRIQAYGNLISRARYTVYSLDGEEALKEGEVIQPGESFQVDLNGEGIMSQERVLEIELTVEEETPVYFYTRIVDAAGIHVPECLDYIKAFHENALGKVEGAGVGTAIEPSEEGDNTTLQHVTIHSNYAQVSWGELKPVVERSERWSIKEMNESSISVQLEYRVRCKGEENESDLYNTKEFFRVRYAPEAQKVYLLDYDRTMEQIFDATKQILSEKGILLGIVPQDVPYMVNEDGSSVSFVVAHELWNYNKNTDEISLVFSFADAESTDVRNLTSQHEIRLLEMDSTGNTTFAVYGYMNRGQHEGEVGIAIYYYDIEKNSVAEKVFISSNKSYGSAIYELGKLVYYSVDRDMLYAMAGGSLYEVRVGKNRRRTLIEGLQDKQYVVSDDGQMVAYQLNGELGSATQISVIDLDTGKEQIIECQEGDCIRPLGFMKGDFVYGVAHTSDSGKTVSGETVIPMYKVEIQSSKGEIMKTYQEEGIYVLEAAFSGNMITLSRATKAGDTYTSVAPDYITNNEEKEESNIYTESYVTELKETQIRLTYNDGISDKEPKLLKPKQVLYESPATVTFDDLEIADHYYVYGYGELQGIYERAGEAIQAADGYNGVVVSSEQAYIWERGNRDLAYTIGGKDALFQSIRERLNQNETPIEILESLGEGEILDFTGCTVEQLLYVINQGMPVIAMLNAQQSVLLIGYDTAYVVYIDVQSGERLGVPYETMDQMTQGSGGIYLGTEVF